MPLFTFHLRDAVPDPADPPALSLPDAEAAFYEAVRAGRALFDAQAEPAGAAMIVRDETGDPVWTIPLIEIAQVMD
jgi:hypothetical protein